MSFPNFVRQHKKTIFDGIVDALSIVPGVFNQPDWRMCKGRLFGDCINRRLTTEIGDAVLRRAEDESVAYDFTYLPATARERVSLKTQETIMQRLKRDGELTVPKEIIIVNTNSKTSARGDRSKRAESGSDWLMAVQHQIEPKQKMAIGIIRHTKVRDMLERGDGNYKVKIYNDEWDDLIWADEFYPITRITNADVKWYEFCWTKYQVKTLQAIGRMSA